MNNNLDHLIPPLILNSLGLNSINLRIVLCGEPVQQRWPNASVCVDDTEIFNSTVDYNIVEFSKKAPDAQSHCDIKIRYYNKGADDTVVDNQGNIIENQMLTIKEIWVNGVDIINTGIIHQDIGGYSMELPQHKLEHFKSLGINLDVTTSLDMYENGIWNLRFKLPILSFLTNKQARLEPWEQVSINELVDDIYQRILVCKELEKSRNEITKKYASD